ncbi:MAG TPA: site-2 protease family protein [Gemmatimonadales bacterium]
MLNDFLLALPMLLFALVAHEFAHGWAAYQQGDDTAYKLGRLTLNPIPHIDPIYTIAMPVALWFLSHGQFTFGGAKPVPVITRNFRNFRRGDLIVSSAGVATNFLLAVACAALFGVIGLLYRMIGQSGTSTVETAQRMLFWGIHLNLILGVFNLIPIPPLDGSRILYHFLPTAWAVRYRSLDRFGFIPLVILLYLAQPVLGWLLTPAWMAESGLIHAVAPFAVGDAWNIFQR